MHSWQPKDRAEMLRLLDIATRSCQPGQAPPRGA